MSVKTYQLHLLIGGKEFTLAPRAYADEELNEYEPKRTLDGVIDAVTGEQPSAIQPGTTYAFQASDMTFVKFPGFAFQACWYRELPTGAPIF